MKLHKCQHCQPCVLPEILIPNKKVPLRDMVLSGVGRGGGWMGRVYPSCLEGAGVYPLFCLGDRGYPSVLSRGTPVPPRGQTDTCENITSCRTAYAGRNNYTVIRDQDSHYLCSVYITRSSKVHHFCLTVVNTPVGKA